MYTRRIKLSSSSKPVFFNLFEPRPLFIIAGEPRVLHKKATNSLPLCYKKN